MLFTEVALSQPGAYHPHNRWAYKYWVGADFKAFSMDLNKAMYTSMRR